MRNGQKNPQIISKSALACELGVTKSSISGYVARGLPILSNGKVDRTAALLWVGANIESHRGGWLLRMKAGKQEAADLDQAFEAGAKALANRLVEPHWMTEFVRVALAFECNLAQAYALTHWLSIAIVSAVGADAADDWIQLTGEPDWRRFAAEQGTKARPANWKSWMRQRLDNLVKHTGSAAQRVPEPSMAPVEAEAKPNGKAAVQ